MRISSVLDWVFPPRCLVCRSFSKNLCGSCRSVFPALVRPYCVRCARPFLSEAGGEHLCADCLRDPPPFGRLLALGRYEGILLDLIARMKFNREERVARFLGQWLGERLVEGEVEVDRVIPVPLHRRRLRERGFNQAVLIGREVADRLKVPLEIFALVRQRETLPQTRLGGEERRRNLKGAFEICGQLRGQKVLLVDDVYTTGATARACARVLRKAGVKEIQVAVVARTP